MKKVIYPDMHGGAAVGEYGIAIDARGRKSVAVIVARGMQLLNCDEGRNELLNRILATELGGVHFDAIRFVAFVDDTNAKEFTLEPDIEEFRRRQGLSKKAEVSSDNLTAGKTWVTTEFRGNDLVSEDERKWMLENCGALE